MEGGLGVRRKNELEHMSHCVACLAEGYNLNHCGNEFLPVIHLYLDIHQVRNGCVQSESA